MSRRRLIDRPLASDGERRQAFLLAAVILVTVAGALVALGPSSHHHPGTAASVPVSPVLTAPATAPSPIAPRSTAPPVVPPTPVAAPSRPQVNRTQDSQNRDPRFRSRVARDLKTRPAFQHLPYHAPGVVIDLAARAPDGRLMLSVTYTGSRAGARRAYRRFLARYRDPGRAYQPRYQHQPSSRRHP